MVVCGTLSKFRKFALHIIVSRVSKLIRCPYIAIWHARLFWTNIFFSALADFSPIKDAGIANIAWLCAILLSSLLIQASISSLRVGAKGCHRRYPRRRVQYSTPYHKSEPLHSPSTRPLLLLLQKNHPASRKSFSRWWFRPGVGREPEANSRPLAEQNERMFVQGW